MEKNTVRIQNVTLGVGIPKVCVPVMGKDLREWTEAATAAREQADLIELRLDSVSPELDADRMRQACRVVREKAQGSALLATMRTSRDGGAGDGDAERYETLLVTLARERLCDALDVELSVGEAAFARIAQEAHAAGVPVVGSYHDFGRTPENAEMLARLHAMARLGADVCKIAVMPRDIRDVSRLKAVCMQANDELPQPIIAISMGELGASTRTDAEAMGSCLSFGTAGQGSAPGQMDARALRRALEEAHQKLSGQ